MPSLETYKKGQIPDSEQVDMSLSPVTQEEMDAEREAFKAEMASDVEVNDSNKELSDKIKNDFVFSEKTQIERKTKEAPRIEELKEELKNGVLENEEKIIENPSPETKLKGVPPDESEGPPTGDDGEELEPIIMHSLHIGMDRVTCPVCKGSGRFIVFFRCFYCDGLGFKSIPNPDKDESSQKIIGWKRKGEEPSQLPNIPPEESDKDRE